MSTPIILVVVIGFICAVLLTIASKVFFVPVDERQTAVREVLPGANCGGCGFAGCDDYAGALVADSELSCSKCNPGGPAVAEQIAEILGRSAGSAEKEVAQVMCTGDHSVSRDFLEYQGMQSCKSAKGFFSGMNACSHGCLGLGDCVNVCDFDSIKVFNGVALVNRNTCVACGKCIKECPQKIIKMVPFKSKVHVMCSSTDKGAVTRKACDNGCIGCKKCEKACKFDAVHVEDNLAAIDPHKCKNCLACARVCPTGAINSYIPIKPLPKKLTPEEIEAAKANAAAAKAAKAAKEAAQAPQA
ncbi:RnfABCDGE type electron transport complex subunit B [Clostridiales Family XIII bacterium RF-744-FAT-WT-3]|uniref:Ion-translocating oxidoreductase complex subunit B n=1 Tax=Baileyella intestinalis TaxID=2606709 RepID=A0A6A8M7A7_9FIRM|nr:RnfABCDGE type electron transport complex subunit B [Baileyella intestinalis]MST68570.1 RnfABCDGE type electron transport complex subunit B [Baileyella intestinalis]